MKAKLRDLVKLFEKINDGSQERNAILEDTLEVSDKFWDELQGLTHQLKTLSDSIANQEPPALEPAIIREQQETLEVDLEECFYLKSVTYFIQCLVKYYCK